MKSGLDRTGKHKVFSGVVTPGGSAPAKSGAATPGKSGAAFVIIRGMGTAFMEIPTQ